MIIIIRLFLYKQETELTLVSFVLNLIFIVKITTCNSKSYQQLKVHIIILKINKNLLISSEAKDFRVHRVDPTQISFVLTMVDVSIINR